MSRVGNLRGIVAGAAILTLFGAAWCIVALANWTARPSWSIATGTAVTIVLLVLCVIRFLSLRGNHSSDDLVAAAKGKRAGMLFGIIFGIEGGMIALSSTLLARYGLSIWIPFAAAIIVGLHFIPLAFVFEVPLYNWTGALSVFGAVGCLLIGDVSARLLCLGLVMAAVLWLTALVLLVKTPHLQSTPPDQQELG
jgi:hypothetical protein